MSTQPALITSILRHGYSVSLEIEEFEKNAWRGVLEKRPAAVFISRSVSPSPSRVVIEFKRYLSKLSRHRARVDLYSGSLWNYYTLGRLKNDWHFKRSFSPREFDKDVFASLKRGILKDFDMQLLIPECREERKNSEFQNFVKRIVAEAAITQSTHTLRVSEGDKKPSDDVSNRQKLRKARHEMLEQVGTYSSEELAASSDSTSPNSSQYALDQRKKNRIFGVRVGQSWLYPKFQFDAKRRIIPDMKEILTALSPDEKGWDRLQWFLEPHETLKGKAPYEVWPSNRKNVIEAAKTERWDGRD